MFMYIVLKKRVLVVFIFLYTFRVCIVHGIKNAY